MIKQIEIIFGFLVLIGVIVILLVGIIWTRPSDNEVASKRMFKQEVLQNELKSFNLDAAYAQISGLEQNGDIPLPVTPSGGNSTITNPFMPHYLR